MKTGNFFIIHGSFSNPQANWFGSLADQIRSKGFEVYTPDFPIGVGKQTYQNWSKLLKFYLSLSLIDENTTIIAHSIAPIFISKFLVLNKIKVKKLIFVCGFNNYKITKKGAEDFNKVNESMYFSVLQKVKDYAKEIVCFFSDNDPYVDYDAEKEFADEVSTKQVLLSGAGHINAESGFTSFKEIEKYLWNWQI